MPARSSIDTFPPSPHDYNSAKKNLEIFAEIEKKRSADALEDVENGRTVLMDRTLWTYIFYEYVLQARFPNRPNAFLRRGAAAL